MKYLIAVCVVVGVMLGSDVDVSAQSKLTAKAAVASAKTQQKIAKLQAFARTVKAARARLEQAYRNYAKSLQSEKAYAASAPKSRASFAVVQRNVSSLQRRTAIARATWLKVLASFKGLKQPGGVVSARGAFRGCMIENKDRPYFKRVAFCRRAAKAYRDAVKAIKTHGPQ